MRNEYGTKVRKIESYEITEKSVRFATHGGRFIEVDEREYSLAWNGHGPFLVLRVYDDAITPVPRAGVVLDQQQAQKLAAEILDRLAGLAAAR